MLLNLILEKCNIITEYILLRIIVLYNFIYTVLSILFIKIVLENYWLDHYNNGRVEMDFLTLFIFV